MTTEDHPTDNDSTSDAITEADFAAIDPTFVFEEESEAVAMTTDDNSTESEPTPDTITEEEDLTDNTELPSEETEAPAMDEGMEATEDEERVTEILASDTSEDYVDGEGLYEDGKDEEKG